jgi:hypothetical protein
MPAVDDRRHPVAAGCGCGTAVLLLAVLTVGPCWLGLALLGARVPGPDELVAHGPAGGAGWLILSTATLVAVLVVALLLDGYMLLSDSAPDPVPRRLYLAWLLVLLPVLGILAMVSAWICFVLDAPDAARYLALGPWLAGLGIAATAGPVYSAVVAADR